MSNTALALVAHPDDAEFLCAGTLALLANAGWNIEIATATAGDKGSAKLSSSEIGAIRKAEAAKAAAVIGAGYHCLDIEDFLVFYDRQSIIKATELVRKVRPRIVFTMSPDCYHLDHEVTSKIAQTACFGGGIPNLDTGPSEPYFHIPHLYYLDPMEGKNQFGQPVKPQMIVDISSVIDTKEHMLSCHESQLEWLKEHNQIDQYLDGMKSFSRVRGEEISVDYGEGYRQHLGHSFPQNNLLKEILKDLVQETS